MRLSRQAASVTVWAWPKRAGRPSFQSTAPLARFQSQLAAFFVPDVVGGVSGTEAMATTMTGGPGLVWSIALTPPGGGFGPTIGSTEAHSPRAVWLSDPPSTRH